MADQTRYNTISMARFQQDEKGRSDMDSIEVEGKTVEEAVSKALEELNVSRERVKVEVLDEGNKGFLGVVGARAARIRATLLYQQSPEKVLEDLLALMDLDAKVTQTEEDDRTFLSVESSDSSLLIGRQGRTLNSLQYIVNRICNKDPVKARPVVLDIEGYRQRRRQSLEALARRMAEKAKSHDCQMTLDPMNSHDRRLIHLALRDDRHVRTFSEGEDPYRSVVIVPRGDKE